MEKIQQYSKPKIKISHETPLYLLQDSLKWNDYQYILPHLIDKYPEYDDFIRHYCNQEDSFSIMDNGLHEDIEHSQGELLYHINFLEPSIFIVPDVFHDTNTTYLNSKHWIENLKEQIPSKTNLMVVLQGLTYSELIQQFYACYNLGYRYFAVNYSSKAYELHFPNKNILISQMMGRIKFIHQFNEVINKWGYNDIYLHLLGCSLPQEFCYYQDYNIINSMDTSNPIIFGALGQRYNDYGILTKPSSKIDNFMEKNLDSQYSDIKFNIYKFKSFVHSKMNNENIIGL
jgi:hypothetical protein